MLRSRRALHSLYSSGRAANLQQVKACSADSTPDLSGNSSLASPCPEGLGKQAVRLLHHGEYGDRCLHAPCRSSGSPQAHAAPCTVARGDPRLEPLTFQHLPPQVALDEARQALAAGQAECVALRRQMQDQAREAAAVGAEAVRAGEQLQECRRKMEAVGAHHRLRVTTSQKFSLSLQCDGDTVDHTFMAP